MLQIGCETCLRLQKSYSEALRQYADALQSHTERITQGDHTRTVESHHAIGQASRLCAERNYALERHEVAEHKKKAVAQ